MTTSLEGLADFSMVCSNLTNTSFQTTLSYRSNVLCVFLKIGVDIFNTFAVNCGEALNYISVFRNTHFH